VLDSLAALTVLVQKTPANTYVARFPAVQFQWDMSSFRNSIVPEILPYQLQN
jgi:hypothetical protein